MAQQLVNNGDSGLVARTKINENDTELYSNIDAVRNLDTVTLSGSTWTLDHESLRAKDFSITSSDATAKTMAFSNISNTADKIEIGVLATFTTACAVTYPSGTTFLDGAPAFSNGEVWALGFLSTDNGTSWAGFARQVS